MTQIGLITKRGVPGCRYDHDDLGVSSLVLLYLFTGGQSQEPSWLRGGLAIQPGAPTPLAHRTP